ncbi:T9SS type B sorting domain-containing protein [uncultured Chryseobacterium sp.]|uniref:T9SS type B sorting domain-containing protein n=1 Tax=uncultured Chryseobacterium sp. TaxID=259322 RepID=UPI0025FCDD4A|nr:T9SS type B sorting domain-containing protein [uncultured Chryseobacterium sp.]
MKKLLLVLLLSLSHLYFSQSDCATAIAVCGNAGQSYTPSGYGNTQESPLGGCLSTEHFSVWYKFTIATGGTLTFVIDPTVDPNNPVSTDYDWAVYGPNVQCGSLGTPVRCSFAAGGGPTGLNMTSTDTTEGAGGDRFVKYMDVLPGETYYMIVDNFSSNTMGFSLTWGGTATLASPFTDPALTPNPFVAPGNPSATPGAPNEILKCQLPTTFDFSTLTTGIVNGNTNFQVSYHYNSNDALTGANPITSPVTVNGTDIYYYSIHYQDPTNPNNPINSCTQIGPFKFKQGNIVAKDANLFACNNNGAGTGTFDLTVADVFSEPTATKKYYPTLNDLNSGTNQIMNPTTYVSGPGKVYVKVTSSEGCSDDSVITLDFLPVVVVKDATLESCFIDSNITTAAFDLPSTAVSTQTGITKKFYTTNANALSQTNEILNPAAYISANGVVYVRVTSTDGCFAISKINLIVLPPVKSTVLKDQTICIEDRTTLDAGPGFDGYEWSTGATTQSIQGVSVGMYWVKLKTGKCFTLQNVRVFSSEQPVITGIEISNNTITISANGGKSPYRYSIDGVNWQDSNVFTGLPRGEAKVYVKDAYDCNPVEVQVTVPNLINVITPNGDNINDEIDYTALAYKKNLVFTIYDRYGNQLYVADQLRNFKWNGTSGGKKVLTGTYWYTISWTENDKNNTQTKYNGWVLVKNRE